VFLVKLKTDKGRSTALNILACYRVKIETYTDDPTDIKNSEITLAVMDEMAKDHLEFAKQSFHLEFDPYKGQVCEICEAKGKVTCNHITFRERR